MVKGAHKGAYKRRPVNIIEGAHEGTTVTSITRDHGHYIVYVVREGDIDVWVETFVLDEGKEMHRAASYRHEVIADYLAAKQRPDLHGRFSSTRSAEPIVREYESRRKAK